MKFLTLIVMFLVDLVAPVAIPLPFRNKNLPSRTVQTPKTPHRGFIKTRKITKCRANVDCSPGHASRDTGEGAPEPRADAALDVADMAYTLPTHGDLNCPGCAGLLLGEHVDPVFYSWRWRYGGRWAKS
ncbi:hypothetical protein AFLA_005679 [Aspergillus flavus NRRL3357]|nr:hypothetical protein AFLA_005679 [Aspergillus flavus NRRL3357]